MARSERTSPVSALSAFIQRVPTNRSRRQSSSDDSVNETGTPQGLSSGSTNSRGSRDGADSVSSTPPSRERSDQEAAEPYATMRPEVAKVEVGRPRLRVSPCSSKNEGDEVRDYPADAVDKPVGKPDGNADSSLTSPASSSLSLVLGVCLGCLSKAEGARPRIEGQGKQGRLAE